MEPGGVGASSHLALGNGDEDTASPIAREWQRFGATVHNEDSDSDHSGEGDGGEDGGEDGSGGGKARRPRGGRGKGTHKGPEFYDELAEAIGEDNVLNYPRSCYAYATRGWLGGVYFEGVGCGERKGEIERGGVWLWATSVANHCFPTPPPHQTYRQPQPR